MKIQMIQPELSFRERYLPQKLLRDITALKHRMEQDTVIIQDNTFRKTIYTRGLSINNGEATFKDGKFLAKRIKDVLTPYGKDTAMIEFDNVRIISDSNGEIIEHKKPFLKSWHKIYEQAETYVRFALENYSNDRIISKQYKKLETANKGDIQQAKKIKEIFDSINPFSDKK